MAVDLALKRHHVKALIRLSGATGLYPECLVLKGIQIIGDAVGGGGFADIYKGWLWNQEIAVKVLKVYQKSDMEKLLKVLMYVIFINVIWLRAISRNSHQKLSYGNNYLIPMCYHSMVFTNWPEIHQGFALLTLGWKMGTWHGYWLIGLLIPIALFWYVTNWKAAQYTFLMVCIVTWYCTGSGVSAWWGYCPRG